VTFIANLFVVLPDHCRFLKSSAKALKEGASQLGSKILPGKTSWKIEM